MKVRDWLIMFFQKEKNC